MKQRTEFTFKPFEELQFSDDFMFGITMTDPDLCHDVIELLMQRPVGSLTPIDNQKEFRHTYDGKPIKLDIYTRDDSSVYDAEMQNLNKKTVESLELPKRTRYYQAMIDTDHLSKKMDYRTLPDSVILFICTFDPFGKGLSQYTFTEQCKELPGLSLGDGIEKHFYNCTYTGEDVPEDLLQFFRYVTTGEPASELTYRINNAVLDARRKEEWRSAYMKEKIILMDAMKEKDQEIESMTQIISDQEKTISDQEKTISNQSALIDKLTDLIKSNNIEIPS